MTETKNPRLRHLPFRLLGTSEIHQRYLEEDPDLAPFLGIRPRDAQELLRRAPVNARRLVSPSDLSDCLLRYAQKHDAPAAALDNARALSDEGAFVVITGQQPGLFGGPLYTIHKAATTVRLAHEISALPNAPKVVPVFWNHTDDHDLDEVNRAFFVNSNLDVQRLRLDLSRGGEFVRDIPMGHAMDQALAIVEDLMPRSEFRDWALSIFRPQDPDEHFGDQLARLLFALFGDQGLLVIEPRDLPPSAFEVLERWGKSTGPIRDVIGKSLDHLTDVGVANTLDPTATLMFQRNGTRRVPLAEGDPVTRANDLSPGALLRPLWQDACLPTLGIVAGPGELGYLSAAGPLYRHLGVPTPALVPRASLTLVEPSLVKLLKRFGWDLADLIVGPEVLAHGIASEEDDPIEEAIAEISRHTLERLDELGAPLRETDQQMIRPLEHTRAKLRDELAKLAVKLKRSRQNRHGTGLRQIRRVCSNLRPKGRLQERALTILPFLVSHGPSLSNHLLEAADPFSTSHGILEL